MSKAHANAPCLSVIKNTRPLRSPGPMELDSGVVLHAESGAFTLRFEDGTVSIAKLAASCLLSPETGDMVLALRRHTNGAYILHVLEKESRDWNLDCPGELRISADSSCTLRGRDVDIAGAGKLSMTATEMELTGASGQVNFLSFSLLAQNMVTRLRKVESFAGRVVQRLGRCLRTVEYENTRAGNINVTVEERYALKAERISEQAEKDVFIDGEKILLG